MLLCSHTKLKVFHSVKNIFLFRFIAVPLHCLSGQRSFLDYLNITHRGGQSLLYPVLRCLIILNHPQRNIVGMAWWRIAMQESNIDIFTWKYERPANMNRHVLEEGKIENAFNSFICIGYGLRAFQKSC